MNGILNILYEKEHMYMSALKRLGIERTEEPIYFKYCDEVLKIALRIKKQIFKYLDSKRIKNVNLQFKDSGLLDLVICETDNHIKSLINIIN